MRRGIIFRYLFLNNRDTIFRHITRSVIGLGRNTMSPRVGFTEIPLIAIWIADIGEKPLKWDCLNHGRMTGDTVINILFKRSGKFPYSFLVIFKPYDFAGDSFWLKGARGQASGEQKDRHDALVLVLKNKMDRHGHAPTDVPRAGHLENEA